MNLVRVPIENSLGRTPGVSLGPSSLKTPKGYEELNLEIDNSNIVDAMNTAYNAIKKLDKAIILGGDHSSSFPCMKAFCEKSSNPAIIIFDAHADAVNNFDPPTHEDFVRTLVESRHIKGSSVFLIGLRNIDPVEADFLKSAGVTYYTDDLIKDNGLTNFVDAFPDQLGSFDSIYLSIDIDVLDPSFAPGTGCPEPGGFSTSDLLYALKRMPWHKIKFADINEINPKLDLNNLTVNVGQKLLDSIVSFMK